MELTTELFESSATEVAVDLITEGLRKTQGRSRHKSKPLNRSPQKYLTRCLRRSELRPPHIPLLPALLSVGSGGI